MHRPITMLTNMQSTHVLPNISLLPTPIEQAPLTTESLKHVAHAPALIIDGTTNLLAARDICHIATRTLQAPPPLLLAINAENLSIIEPDWGIADFVTPQTSATELQTRLHLLHSPGMALHFEEEHTSITIADALTIDPVSFTAHVHGRALDLTYREFELLHYFASHQGHVISRDVLLQDVWGFDYYGGSRTVDVHVRRLRAKLGPKLDSLITTVRNVGYRFDVPHETNEK
ncbi:MAG: response regulator transcription factor [Actinomycetaceae bacterium]|nr:response regulator transcription factor [Actinomycetaceae bacterium]